jgi:hypothetical protein
MPEKPGAGRAVLPASPLIWWALSQNSLMFDCHVRHGGLTAPVDIKNLNRGLITTAFGLKFLVHK